MKFTLIIDKSKEEEITARVHDRSPLTDRIQELILEYTGQDRVPAYTEDDMVLLPFSDIACVTVQEGKTWAIDARGSRYRLKLRLYELEEQLPSSFIRINKSAIANEAHLERFAASFSGAVDAVFTCGYREYVSRRCFAQIKRRFENK